MPLNYSLAFASILLLALTSNVSAQSIESLGHLKSAHFHSEATGISDDGKKVVGWSTNAGFFTSFLWTEETGLKQLGINLGYSVAQGISGDGKRITLNGFIHTDTTERTYFLDEDLIPTLLEIDPRMGLGKMSKDGRYALGNLLTDQGFRINIDSGELLDLGGFEDHSGVNTDPLDISGDGSVIVGIGNFAPVLGGGSEQKAFIWNGSFQEIPISASHEWSNATGISEDGKTIVGVHGNDSCQGSAFQWKEGVVTSFPGVNVGRVVISPNGRVKIGKVLPECDNSANRSLIKIDDGPFQDFLSYLTSSGVDYSGWTRLTVTDLSSNGNFMVGHGMFAGKTTAFRIELTSTDLIVNRPGDEADANIEDNICDTDLGTAVADCTLRAAIQEANERDGADRIIIKISDGLSKVIEIKSSLPVIQDSLSIIGQGTENGPKNAHIDGSGTTGDGLRFTSGSGQIAGLAIGGFTGAALHFSDEAKYHVLSNYIGTDAAGKVAKPNGVGIWIESPNNSIGRDGGNLISGNSWPDGRAGAGSVPDSLMGSGIVVSGQNATNTSIDFNWIGVSFNDSGQLANSIGIALMNAKGVKVGANGSANFIAGNPNLASSNSPNTVGDLSGIGVLISGDDTSEIEIGTNNRFGISPLNGQVLPNAIDVLVANAPGVKIMSNILSATKAPSDPGQTPLSKVYGSSIVLLGEKAGMTEISGNWIGINNDGSDFLQGDYAISLFGTQGFEMTEFNIINADKVGLRITGLGEGRSLNTVIKGQFFGVLPNVTRPDSKPIQGIGIEIERATDTRIGVAAGGSLLGGFETGIHVRGKDEGDIEVLELYGNVLGSQGLVAFKNNRGIWLEGSINDTKLGGWTAGEGNLVSGNGVGIMITPDRDNVSLSPTQTIISGNGIGIDNTGLAPLPNGVGLFVGGAAMMDGAEDADGIIEELSIGASKAQSGNAPDILRRNIISGNSFGQVWIHGGAGSTQANPTQFNHNWIGIFADGSGSIETPNQLQEAAEFGIAISGTAKAHIGDVDERLVVGNSRFGILLKSDGNNIINSFIGTDPSGSEERATESGILIASSFNEIGIRGGIAGPNLISGNTAHESIPISEGVSITSDQIRVTGLSRPLRFNLEETIASDAQKNSKLGLPRPRRIQFKTSMKSDPCTDAGLTFKEIQDNTIAFNLIGTNSEATSALSTPGSLDHNLVGIAISAGVKGSKIYSNVISGNGIGIGIGSSGSILCDGVLPPSGNKLAANRIGLARSSSDPIPNNLFGLQLFDTEENVIGKGAIPGVDMPNIIANTGRDGGSGLPPNVFGSPGIFTLAPEFKPFENRRAAVTRRNRIEENLFFNNDGLAITRDFEQYGPTPTSPTNSDGGTSIDPPILVQALSSQGILTLVGAASAKSSIQVYSSPSCDDSGFGEGQHFIETFTVPGLGPFSANVSLPPWEDGPITLLGIVDSGTSTEFSRCLQPVATDQAVSADVSNGATGEILGGPDTFFNVESHPSGVLGQQLAGTVYSMLYDTRPDSSAIEGSAQSSDGSTVTPNDIAKNQYWELQQVGLQGIRFEICLPFEDIDGVGNPEQLLVLHREHRGYSWTAKDSYLADKSGVAVLCSNGLESFGHFTVGGESAVNPVDNEESPEEFDIRAFAYEFYPNPSRDIVRLKIDLPAREVLEIDIVDLNGRSVVSPLKKEFTRGSHRSSLDTSQLSSGVYLLRIQREESTDFEKLVVVK